MSKKRTPKKRRPLCREKATGATLTLRDLVLGAKLHPPCYEGITEADGSEILEKVRQHLNEKIAEHLRG